MSKENQLFLVGEDNELNQSLVETLNPSFEVIYIPHHSWANELRKYEPIIVLFYQGENQSPVESIKELGLDFPNASSLYVHSEEDFDLLREATRAGAEDFIVFPDERDVIEERINQLFQQHQTRSEAAVSSGTYKRGNGKIFAFYSGKGGAGKTLLSTAFAQTLKFESTAQVIHIDFNLQYGGSETYLGIESNRSLIDLLPVINELNEHHIKNISEHESHSKLEVLVSPRDAEMAEKIDEDFVIRLLRACKRSYDFIIIDLPSTIDVKTYTALEEADHIYYVMTLDTPAIRVLKHVEDLLNRLGVHTQNRMELVINFTGRENELTKKDIEKFVDIPISTEIRRDIKGVQAAINQGEPLRKGIKEKKLTAPAKDIQKWVTAMLK
ncbi:AAA family ATPase [Falsibacillus pallidus]|uniref:Pilus assembly protein CpaE n=1 Tax=Falsibacillus pallidus TaxID=493781 RepID=A0A370G541_9BACI|nr:AAA family ATPase [Falsibacillus pallidus]RDI37939.1 pilus assembly protein CpaE [Falsibacillus pallidus]